MNELEKLKRVFREPRATEKAGQTMFLFRCCTSRVAQCFICIEFDTTLRQFYAESTVA